MFECTSPAKKFPPKIVNEKNFLSTQQIQKKTEQQFYIEEKNKQVHLQIKMHLKNIIKIEKYKKTWSTKKVSKNKHTTDKDKKQSNTLAD